MTPAVKKGRLLLRRLREEGLSVASDGHTVALSPATRLDETLLARAREEKTSLIAALRMEHAKQKLDLVPVNDQVSNSEAQSRQTISSRLRRRNSSHPGGECRECETTDIGPTATTCGSCRWQRWEEQQE